MDIEGRLVLCNAPPEAADRLARALVEERLAACVNLIPKVTSIYRWEGKLCCEEEVTLLIKTAADRLPALTEAIRRLHPYELPEVIALALEPNEGEERYLRWLVSETRVNKGAG